ncbi:MAG: RNA polymerase sigma factor [Bacteroidetes bacterium]|nr:MAG: RNA polymerase sigma factor [Bacteroidota bacterium]REK00681.1 MAG: RNA polymerase sigma factor [Bacteroidota bacterium]REK35197.1 MAG: RNA polymerase sigma factor [Bacteroidota bacterium]REK48274.1 MAG: RNA polymerase sigma factor [Bacteroidota bacterium]
MSSEFKNLVSDESRPLRMYALKLTHDLDDANDLVQETMLKAFVNEEKFRKGTNLKGWLYTIMKNIFINKYRRAMKSNIFNDPTENQYFINSGSQTHRNDGEGNLVMKEISHALNELKENLRTPFLMSYNGYKYEEIASKLEIPLGTVKVRIHNARKELMKKLKSYH